MDRISEKDWKQLRKMEKEKIAIVSNRALDKFRRIIDAPDSDPYATCLKLFQAMREEDNKLADMFDNLKRSGAIANLVNWYRDGVLSDEELTLFTTETRERILRISEIESLK